MNIKTICLAALLCCSLTILQARGDLILTIELTNEVQTANSVTYDIEASFEGDAPSHFIDSITLDLGNSSLGLQDGMPASPFSRFRVDDDFWLAGLDTATGSLQLDPVDLVMDVISDGQINVRLARLSIDTTGLMAATYNVSLFNTDPLIVDAFGDFGAGPEFLRATDDFTSTPAGEIIAPAVSFSITAIPEPSSVLLLSLAGMGVLVRRRRS